MDKRVRSKTEAVLCFMFSLGGPRDKEMVFAATVQSTDKSRKKEAKKGMEMGAEDNETENGKKEKALEEEQKNC